MKRLFSLLLVGLMLLCITGCGKVEDIVTEKPLTKEQQLCKNIEPSIEKFNNKNLTYDGFLNAIKADYDSTCTDNSNNVCVSIKSMYQMQNVSYELQDCSKYNVNEKLGKSMKDLCEATNNTRKEMLAKKTETEEAYVNNLRVTCERENEK